MWKVIFGTSSTLVQHWEKYKFFLLASSGIDFWFGRTSCLFLKQWNLYRAESYKWFCSSVLLRMVTRVYRWRVASLDFASSDDDIWSFHAFDVFWWLHGRTHGWFIILYIFSLRIGIVYIVFTLHELQYTSNLSFNLLVLFPSAFTF